mgnify:FL=1
MTQYAAAVVVCIIAVETFMRLPLKHAIASLHNLISKITRVVTSAAISDHWKEKVLLNYAGSLAIHTIKLAVIFLVGGAIIALSTLLIDAVLPDAPPTLEFLMTAPGLITATVVSTVYFMLRKPRGN